ncbi:glycosyltransferase family 2 protein [Capillimicrobium parvum]|uniref:Undecaprenyl-phosphate 4-deoxy-4-formamido-L-arabinose transferase n=1 Tax=Capillimicrobium parvum TaxID=2884022 RepID=A0A9E6XX42_9ACTN|nr:glycosyltransferase family 2 protein [Capillimicrobium parvum]UGS36122.1 Undecaprenyl-phosphate 4-deoxy-4-formamido-L-arabinose transferase [Capillimicrobium parvum]
MHTADSPTRQAPGSLPPPAPPRPDARPSRAPTETPRAPDLVLPGLSIVLPCLNEQANVADAIRAAARAASHTSLDYEIIVVDDGSTDATAEIAAGFVPRDRRVRLLIHPANRGYGAALRTGITAASMPWILLTDADLQFDLDELDDFLPQTATADLVIGWRILRRDPVGRRMNAAAWNWLVRRVFHLPVRDVDCAFKLLRASALDGITLTANGAMIDTELLVRCLAAGARITELGVHHRPRINGRQSGASPRVVMRAFAELARLRRQLAAERRAAAA